MSDVVWEQLAKWDRRRQMWYLEGRGNNGRKIRKYIGGAQGQAPPGYEQPPPVFPQDETTPRDMDQVEEGIAGLNLHQSQVGSYDDAADEYSYGPDAGRGQGGATAAAAVGSPRGTAAAVAHPGYYPTSEDYGHGFAQGAPTAYQHPTTDPSSTNYPQVPDPALYRSHEETPASDTQAIPHGQGYQGYSEAPGTTAEYPASYDNPKGGSKQHHQGSKTKSTDQSRSKKDKHKGQSSSSRHKGYEEERHSKPRNEKRGKGKEVAVEEEEGGGESTQADPRYAYGASPGAGQYMYPSAPGGAAQQMQSPYNYPQDTGSAGGYGWPPAGGQSHPTHPSEGSGSLAGEEGAHVRFDLPATEEDEEEAEPEAEDYEEAGEANEDYEEDDDMMAAMQQSRNVYEYDPGLAGNVGESRGESSTMGDPAYAPADEGTQTPKAHTGSSFNIQGTPGQVEPLDPRYKVEPSSRFEPGEVFKVLWYEPRGSLPGGGSVVSEMTRLRDHYKDVFVGFRRFIVIANDEGHCACVPILTYDRQGCKKKGVKHKKHGIIYEEGTKSKPLRDEPPLGFPPICMRVTASNEKISRESRVNYSKIVTVEHNVKVFFIGYVLQDDVPKAQEAVNKCWADKVHEKSHHGRRRK